MRIADFARASGLPQHVLRHYHRRGLLVPATVDPSTGYRGYDERQVDVALRLRALLRTGMALEEAARVAAAGDTVAVAAHLRGLEEHLAVLRAAATTAPEPSAPGEVGSPSRAHSSVVVLAPVTVVSRRVRLEVHGVAEGVRRARASLRAALGRSPAPFPLTRLPPEAPAPATHDRHPDARRPEPTGMHVRLVRPDWTGREIDVELTSPWPRARPAPPGWVASPGRPRRLVLLAVGPLTGLSLVDVLEAHRSLAAGAPDGARVWQLYDARVSRLWVAREV